MKQSSDSEKIAKQQPRRIHRDDTQQRWIPKLIRAGPNHGRHVRQKFESALERSLGGGKRTAMGILNFLFLLMLDLPAT